MGPLPTYDHYILESMIQAERQGKGNGRKTGEICAKMEPHDIIGDPLRDAGGSPHNGCEKEGRSEGSV